MQTTMQTVRPDPLPQRRHRKMLKDGTSEVWPQEAENVFLDGLREYWNSPWANFSRGRSRWRNQYLVDYLKKNGIERSKKQVASHIQVLRNMWKGHPEFCLVAGPDELSEASSTSDRHSPPQRSSKISPSPSRRRASVSHSSPPSTPTSFDADYSELGPHRSPSFSLSPLTTIKTEYPQVSPFETPSGLPSVLEMGFQPSPISVNRVAGLCLWADSMDPNYIDVDALPFASPSSPGLSASPNGSTHIPPSGVVRTSLRVKLTMPVEATSGSISGFSGALSFAGPVAPSAECLTRVHVDNTCVSRETGRLIPVNEPAGGASRTPFVAMLPDSWLTRCRLLDTEGKKTIVTQQVVVDAEAIFVVIYDLHRTRVSPGPMGSPSLQRPTAELMLWNKHVDSAVSAPPPPALLPLPMSSPTTSRFGDAGNAANAYLYSTAAALTVNPIPQYMSPVQHHSPHSPSGTEPHGHHNQSHNSPGLGHAARIPDFHSNLTNPCMLYSF